MPKYSPKPVSAEYYYKIPVRTIYKSYPIYAPGRVPAGYLEKLKNLEPEIAFDASRLKTKEDWIRAGEIVFEARLQIDEGGPLRLRCQIELVFAHQCRLTKEGILPHCRYVIRQKGKVEVGGSVVRNVPPQRARRRHGDQGWTGQFSGGPRHRLLQATWDTCSRRDMFLSVFCGSLGSEQQRQFESYSLEEIAGSLRINPRGCMARSRSSPLASTCSARSTRRA